MKKIVLTLTALILLSACSSLNVIQAAEPYCFYYTAESSTKTGLDEIVDLEMRYLPGQDLDIGNIIEQYLIGPSGDGLVSPFPADTGLVKYKLSGGIIAVTLSEEYLLLEGVKKTIADYCLTMTLTALDEIDTVSIAADGYPEALISVSDFITADDFESYSEDSVTIYFADLNNRYLLPETRRMVASENESIERYVVEQLISGPTSGDKQSIMPGDTKLITITTEDGLCVVNFSDAFLLSRPQTEAQERMTVYAIVNSLTGVNGIDSVLIRAGGDDIGLYRYMYLSEPLERNEGAIGMALSATNVIDATFYMKNWSPDFLSAIPAHITKITGRTEEYSVAYSLIEYLPSQGYLSPIPAGTRLISTQTDDGLCVVDLSSEFIDNCARGASAQRLAIMSVVLSLTEFEHIDRVQITVDGVARDHLDYPMSEPFSRDEELLFP